MMLKGDVFAPRSASHRFRLSVTAAPPRWRAALWRRLRSFWCWWGWRWLRAGVPRVELRPDLVLSLLLPPLLYSSGVGMSWHGFKQNLRPILSLAVGCVIFTALATATVMHALLGVPWAVGFVLGAVVSPPDAVAPMAIARRFAVPCRILTVLEGEGLVNDATALILFSFALGAVAEAEVFHCPLPRASSPPWWWAKSAGAF